MERTLGEVVQRRRRELRLTQEELAEQIGGGVRQADVSRLERGRVALPRRERLERLAAALDLPIGELLVLSGWGGADRAFDQRFTANPSFTEPAERAEVPDPPREVTEGVGAPYGSRQLAEAFARSRAILEQTEVNQRRATETIARLFGDTPQDVENDEPD